MVGIQNRGGYNYRGGYNNRGVAITVVDTIIGGGYKLGGYRQRTADYDPMQNIQ